MTPRFYTTAIERPEPINENWVDEDDGDLYLDDDWEEHMKFETQAWRFI